MGFTGIPLIRQGGAHAFARGGDGGRRGGKMGYRVFRVALEPDEDVWRAYVPALEPRGAAT